MSWWCWDTVPQIDLWSNWSLNFILWTHYWQIAVIKAWRINLGRIIYSKFISWSPAWNIKFGWQYHCPATIHRIKNDEFNLKSNTIQTHHIKLGSESEHSYIFLVIKFGASDSNMPNPESSRNMPLKMHIFSCTRKTIYCSSRREREKHYLWCKHRLETDLQ